MTQSSFPAFLYSQSPWTTVGILLGAILLLYFARNPAHRAIKNFFRVLKNAMRLASLSVIRAEKRLVARNKEVLLATGMEAVERSIEREFHRVNTVVERDLQGYPAMNRTLSEEIAKIDLDYRESGEVPPAPPAWIEAVDGIAKIPDNGSNMVKAMLAEIHKTLANSHKEMLKEYRKATAIRHSLLSKMMPSWRKIEKNLEEVGKHITTLQERAKVIDTRMQEYEDIRRGTDKSFRVLSSSSLTQFFISGFVLLVAIGGAIINFNLIALPMSEMVGAGARLAGFQVSEVAALVIILIEVAIGLYLMEALRITKLFPVVGSLDDKLRLRLAWTFFVILTILACIESALAFMRDIIAADRQALLQSLADSGHPAQPHSMIPTIGQMIMGFILPFALTFVAVPLESFIHSSRTVLGIILVGFLRFLSFFLRLFGNVFHYLGSFFIGAYDLIIFLPLWGEEFFLTLKGQHAEASGGSRNAAKPPAKSTAKEIAAK